MPDISPAVAPYELSPVYSIQSNPTAGPASKMKFTVRTNMTMCSFFSDVEFGYIRV